MATTILVGGLALSGHVLAQTLPSGGQVVAGTATISNSGSTTTVSQSSDKAIVTWNDFSIGQGGTVTFNNGSGATLNRVTGSAISNIDGLLKATGSVYLINANGVIIGKTGVINVGGTFVASALDVSNENFLSGDDLTFAGGSLASVVNLGKIGALGGDVSMMAVNVQNSGEINAANGTVGLLAGRNIILRDTALDDGKFLIVTGGSDTSVTNEGAITARAAELRAEGGNIYALAGNTDGVIRATGVSGQGGKIWLSASDTGSVAVSGSTLAAADAAGNGGAISVTGGKVSVASGATLDASATAANGAGGTVSVIADMISGSLTFTGAALARGGSASGNGGTVETSGASVDFDGAKIDTSAAGGQSGDWLIDPYNLTVGTAAAATISSNLATTNVTLQTTANGTSGDGVQSAGDGDIIIDADISWSSGNTLTLDAYHGVTFNGNVTVSGSGGLLLKTNDGGSGGDYNFTTGHGLNYTGSGGSLTINGDVYTLLYSMSDFSSMTGSSGHYALATSVDASGTTYSSSVVNYFYGTFEGLGHTIDGLHLYDQYGMNDVGLFGYVTGTLRDIGVTNASVTSGTNGMGMGEVGILAGLVYTAGVVKNAYTTGSVLESDGGDVGGLVGINYGTISNAYSAASVTNTNGYTTGGLVGDNAGGSITNAYATGAVIGGSGFTGGLAGFNEYATITNAYATGAVSATTTYGNIGGIAGYNLNGTLTNTYFNNDTTGQTVGVQGGTTTGATGLTTAQLQSGTLPTGFDASAWGTAAGLYPYLTVFGTITADQKVSGYVYNADGSVANAATVGVYENGSLLTGATASSGNNGYYYIIVPANTADTSSKLGATLTPNGASTVSGVTYTDSPTLTAGDVTDLNVTSGIFSISTQDSSTSAMLASMVSAFGVNTFASIETIPANTRIVASSDFLVDTFFDFNGDLLLQSGGDLTIDQNAQIAAEGSGDAITIAADGSFINLAGANALSTPSGRWLIYTQAHGDATSAAANNDFGGLAGKSYYNDAFDFSTGTLASAPNSGNRFVTGYAPVLTVTADTKTVTYTGSTQTDTYSVSGYLSNDAASDLLTGSLTGLTTGSKNVGTYALTPGGTLASDENYGITYASGTLTINPAPLLLAAVTDTKTYDSTTTSTVAVDVQDLQTGDTVSNVSQSFGSKNVMGTDGSILTVNSGYVINDGNNGNNYVVSYQAAWGTINPATLTLAAVTDSKTYDATTTSSGVVDVSGLKGSDSVTGASQSYNSKNVLGAGGSTLSVNSGYSIDDGNGGNNYTVTTQTASGTITPASLTLAAVTDSKVYDATTASSGTVAVSGLKGLDSVTGVTQSYNSKNVLGAGGSTLNVNNSYTINDGNGGNNYAVATQTASGTITPATLVAGLTGTVEKTYDATSSALLSAGNYSLSGIYAGDNVSLNNPTSGTYADVNAGSGKSVTVAGLALSGSDLGNYIVNSSASGNVGLIDTRSITITADNIAKLMSAADPALTYHLTSGNLVGVDALSGGLTRISGELQGTYAVTQGSLAASSNYTVNFVGATFTITSAAMQNQPTVNPVQSIGGANISSWSNASVGSSGSGAGAAKSSDPDADHNSSSSEICTTNACLNQPYPGNQSFSSFVSFLSH